MQVTTQDIQKVKKAYFQQYGSGKQVLKIWYKTGSCEELTKENFNNRSIHPEIAYYCFSLGFQHDTYPIDNRTEQEYIKDWNDHVTRCYNLGLTPQSFEQYKNNQNICF